jgi:2-polyprenyl-3-methyl-5-hydroxy-6-metoxy-1,4-benzoquinol methylase
MTEHSPGTPPDEWDEYASGWDGDRAARAYAAAAFESLHAAIMTRGMTLDGAVVCDFGCGTGLLTERLAPNAARIDAVDTSPGMLEVLQAKIDRFGWTNVTTHREVPADAGSYDLIVCSSVCSFLDDYPGAVVQLAHRLAAGGAFVQWDWERDPLDEDLHGLSRAEVRDALEGARLVSVQVETGFEATADGNTMSPLMGIGQKPR